MYTAFVIDAPEVEFLYITPTPRAVEDDDAAAVY
jgi:hypothetical protein